MIRVEDVELPITGQGFLSRFDEESGFRHDRQSPRQNSPAKPVNNSVEMDEAARHGDIGQVPCPHLIGPGDRQLAQEVRINFVAWCWLEVFGRR